MSALQLIDRTEEINSLVDQEYVDPSGKASPIHDGIIKFDLYQHANYRILWILKEPYDEDDASGGGWSLTKDFMALENVHEKVGRGPTFQPIIYVSFAILNGFKKWSEMSWIRDDPAMAKALWEIAFINVSKLPRYHRADDGIILQSYQRHKSLIHKQIESCSPHIVIGCRPHMPQIMCDLGCAASEITQSGSIRYASNGTTAFLDVYHPGQTCLSREEYVDGIVDAARHLLAG